MYTTTSELGELLDLLKSKGVYRFKSDSLEVEFSGLEEVPVPDIDQKEIIFEDEQPMSEYELQKTFKNL